MASNEPVYDRGVVIADTIDPAALPLHADQTESHALAVADHDEKGAAQVEHGELEVKDLGWHDHPELVPSPLVGGLDNEELWMLIRRFNKQMYHVKAIHTKPPGGLDLNIAGEEEFSPDKLRANFERLYMTVVVGMMAFAKHIARIRSWRETRRTAVFCAVYSVAWYFNIVAPAIFAMLIVLIGYPPARPVLFPPVPLALVDAKTGGLKKPGAGMLGSHGSLTGAPETHEGEAVEQEAHNFVSSLAAVGLGVAAGKENQSATDGDGRNRALDRSIPDPTHFTTEPTEGNPESSIGFHRDTKHDKTKQPMELAVWEKARPAMRALAEIADAWERVANALSPTKPFDHTGRYRLAGVLVPVVAGSLFANPAVLVRSMTFVMGFAFFGDPVFTRSLELLNYYVPEWKKALDPRNHIFYAVPTNAQLTLTLLRIGEARRAPIPPPPRSAGPPSAQPAAIHPDDVPLDASSEEIHDAIHPDANDAKIPGQEHLHDAQHVKKPRHGRKVLAFLKSATKAGVSTVLGTDRLKAHAGNEHAKNRLGVLPDHDSTILSGPTDFLARHHGKKGHLYISTASTAASPIPCIFYSTESSAAKAATAPPVFEIAIPAITGLKKVGGLGWKAKLIVGWALDRELADGLEIVDDRGHTYLLTAIPLRDELFNRLVALDGQKWESW
ncbi:MAG: hypothetical protein M1826_004896 [Phylliscum demangeonii]|nr:MAG: hypothetical protein M1826_004896 [Phylliscum demangeonii]